jgi:DNA processing protein
MTADDDEQAALIALLRTQPQGMSWADIMTEVVAAGSATEVWANSAQPMLVPDDTDAIALARVEIDTWLASGMMMTTILDDTYPRQLRGIHQAPPVLFARGDLRSRDDAVSVVGSREASARGKTIAAGIAQDLVERGLTVIAGLALGIDTAAHRAALDAGGRTVAVIGTGINGYYPPPNHDLQDEIAANGLVLSQFWPDAPATRRTFPMRNITMSGYGIATVVVEAGERSGTRTQARAAVGHGRPVILTDLLVENTKWARDLAERPGVFVARGRSDVAEIVANLRSPFDSTADAGPATFLSLR